METGKPDGSPASGIQNPEQNVDLQRKPFCHLKGETSYLPMINLSFATRGLAYFYVLITFNTNNSRNPRDDLKPVLHEILNLSHTVFYSRKRAFHWRCQTSLWISSPPDISLSHLSGFKPSPTPSQASGTTPSPGSGAGEHLSWWLFQTHFYPKLLFLPSSMLVMGGTSKGVGERVFQSHCQCLFFYFFCVCEEGGLHLLLSTLFL